MNLTDYLAWMRDVESFPFIESVNADYSQDQLVDYIEETIFSSNSLMFSVFTKNENLHIGNVKFHDINLTQQSCWVGFLIGNKQWRNRGVARESFLALSSKLNACMNLAYYHLGVHPNNYLAINSYLKMGFKETVATPLRIEMLYVHRI
jgi:RimJ/RimL family protein N-acetyltransferase